MDFNDPQLNLPASKVAKLTSTSDFHENASNGPHLLRFETAQLCTVVEKYELDTEAKCDSTNLEELHVWAQI